MIQKIFDDEDILIINKEPGVALQGKDENLLDDLFKGYHIITRIDQPVSGACIIAKNKTTAAFLTSMLQNKQIEKEYIAIVEKHPKEESKELTDIINKRGSKAYIDKSKGKVAKLKYKVIKRLDNYTVLDVNISTGRFHQIRAQLSNFGHCIKGDLKYGAKRSNKHPGIYLHCRKIAFVHPISNKKIEIIANFPNYGLWEVI